MPQRSTLLVIVGLPGSGKTTYLKSLIENGQLDGFCDDYEFGPLKRVEPKEGPEDKKLLKALAGGKRWAIADTRYCDVRERDKLAAALSNIFPNLNLEFIYFENSPDACAHNATFRKGGELPKHEINLIYYYSPIYVIPKGAAILKIHRATTKSI